MSIRVRSVFAALVLGSLSCGPVSPAAVAAEIRHSSQYDISLGILPIATASFDSSFDGKDYKITGSFAAAGIARILTKTSAETTVTGRVLANRLQADRYNLVYHQGKRTRVYDVEYRNGDVAETTIKPEPKRNADNWIPVSDKDLHSVLDPLSGLIFPADAKICPNRLPIFDGESRLDLVLSPMGTKPFTADGFKGEAIVCEIRYQPKSGYRRGRDDIEYLKKTPMEIWFAKAQSANVYAPVYARIPTRIGQLYVTAVKYGG
ncbi:MAG: DUF3108 domain-containing protein [Neorhizobium sp.]|jgi:hypothetical protein|nr:DUF3108 domain-containing protein [Neorhizobium sp.]